MKDKIYLVSPNFIEEKVKKIFEMPGDIGFIAQFGLLSGLREQEIIYIYKKEICNNCYGCNCDRTTCNDFNFEFNGGEVILT